jgi:light-regulated signal transduction histidine kinase (bacteriophytochrome)
MQTLIDSLLNYSRATTKELILQPLALSSVIEDVKKDLADVIEEKRVAITFNELPVIRMERLQFQQLFFNFIENAKNTIVRKCRLKSGF